MRKRALTCAVSVLALVALLVVTVRLADIHPSDHKLHVRATRIGSEPLTEHWRWTFSGDHRWETFSTQAPHGKEQITLDHNRQPLSFLSGMSGSRVIEYDISVTAGPSDTPGQRSYSLQILMIGDSGSPASSSGTAFTSSTRNMADLFKPLQTRDRAFILPASIDIAIVDGKTYTLVFPR